jgi:hypothetical protein
MLFGLNTRTMVTPLSLKESADNIESRVWGLRPVCLADGTTNGRRVVLIKPYEGLERGRVRILLSLIPTPAHTGLHPTEKG